MDYIVAGEWVDRNWHELAKQPGPLTTEEVQMLFAGPRRHPYGLSAYSDLIDGHEHIFPSLEAAARFHHERDHDAA